MIRYTIKAIITILIATPISTTIIKTKSLHHAIWAFGCGCIWLIIPVIVLFTILQLDKWIFKKNYNS